MTSILDTARKGERPAFSARRKRKARVTRRQRQAGETVKRMLAAEDAPLIMAAGESLGWDPSKTASASRAVLEPELRARVCEMVAALGGTRFRGLPLELHGVTDDLFARVAQMGIPAKEAALRLVLWLAGVSLGLSGDAIDIGTEVSLRNVQDPSDFETEVAAALGLRACAMLTESGIGHFRGEQITTLLAQWQQKHGEDFVQQVAATGEPLQAAALRIRYSWVNLARALAASKNAAWNGGKCDGWRLRFIHGERRLSSSGRRFERRSSRRRESSQRSLSGSISRPSTRPSSSESASPNSQSGERAAPSSVRQIRPARLRHCASSTANRPDAFGLSEAA